MAVPESSPERYWDEKARKSGGDPLLAACIDDPIANRGIDGVQQVLARAALEQVQRRRSTRGGRALDHGCGSGRWFPLLTAWGWICSGVDVSAEMLAIAHRLHPALELRKGDGLQLPFPDASFDLVWSFAVLHHNTYARQETMLREMERVLRRGGCLVMFEGLGARVEDDPLYHPRPLPEWIAAGEALGLHGLWQRTGRYAVLDAALGRFGPLRTERAPRFWRAAVNRIDAVVDPHLQRLIPAQYCTRAAMLFEKPGGRAT
ncbi:MAG TPA: class I SAM-dependent methyltransferase [Burkholderiaceae bacterium]|nr:class I SAM-dependent methyltransferase [Burkholderiaceae bacterium]